MGSDFGRNRRLLGLGRGAVRLVVGLKTGKNSSVASHPDGVAIDCCCRKSGLEMEEKTLLKVYERDFRDKATKIKLPSESSWLC